MKKLPPFNRKLLTVCLYAFATVAAIILFNKFVSTTENLPASIQTAFRFVTRLLAPFFTALVLAYLLNPAVEVFERWLKGIIKKEKFRKLRRGISIGLVYALLLGLCAMLIYFTVPQVVRNVGDLISSMPKYYTEIMAFIDRLAEEQEIIKTAQLQDEINQYLIDARASIISILTNALNGVTGWIADTFSWVLNFFLGFVMSIYLLNESGTVLKSIGGFISTLLGPKRTKPVFAFVRDVDDVFSRFISAKLLQVVYMYIMAQIAFILLGVPYHALMAVVVALTNLIPYIGPYIGGVAPMLVTLMDNPIRALYVLGVLCVMQALDNNVLSPIITGERMGISPFWVMVATLLFGGLFGLVGMVLAAPMAAVFNLLLQRFLKWYRAYQKKKIAESAPPPQDDAAPPSHLPPV